MNFPPEWKCFSLEDIATQHPGKDHSKNELAPHRSPNKEKTAKQKIMMVKGHLQAVQLQAVLGHFSCLLEEQQREGINLELCSGTDW